LADNGYTISTSTFNKYELGHRRPAPQFVHAISVCLILSKDETEALVDACIADMTQSFMREYIDALAGSVTMGEQKHDEFITDKNQSG
jgi:hypothetical protein